MFVPVVNSFATLDIIRPLTKGCQRGCWYWVNTTGTKITREISYLSVKSIKIAQSWFGATIYKKSYRIKNIDKMLAQCKKISIYHNYQFHLRLPNPKPQSHHTSYSDYCTFMMKKLIFHSIWVSINSKGKGKTKVGTSQTSNVYQNECQ